MALALLGLSKIKPPKQYKPHIAKDTVSSNSIFGGMYGLSEGEIAGLVDGGKSIFLDGTPLINANGQPNFSGVEWEFRSGTNNQSHIAGFPAVENEHSVGVELRHDKPWTTQINNTQLSAIAVRLNWHALRHQHANGDVTGYRIDYAVDVQTDSGSFVEVIKTHIQEKTSQGYKRSHRIELPKAKRSWTLRVRRLTANQDNEMIGDRMSIDAVTHIIDAKLRYPNTAVLGIKYDAQIFGNVAKLSVLLKGKLIAVPTNYDPDTRTYTGLWDGAFKQAYSNNPAWIFYDVCTNKRYGLGERLTGMMDKWSLYRIAQYCDEMVNDGKGGQEPRFTCNVYLQKQEDAYTVLKNLASIFRAMMYYDGEQIVLDIDGPKDPVYTFSAANVIDGSFQYAGTRARDRHTAARVAWDNPDNDYKTEYTNVKDEEAIARFGLRFLDINAFGCTSLGQAQRAGMWALKSEQLETRTVVFRTGLQGYIPKIGEVINIADNLFAGRAISGRIASVSQDKRSITLDRDVIAKAGDTLVVNGSGSIEKRTITSAKKSVITVDNAFVTIAADDVWAIDSDSLRVMPFRILSAEQDGTIFTITALQHAPQKYVAIDDGAYIAQNPISVLNPNPIAGPDSVVIGSYNRVIQGQNVTTLTISWSQVERAAYYLVEWKKDDGNWMLLPKVAGQSVDIDGVYAGQYIARVRAVDAFDNESLATSSQLTQIAGKIGRPPKLARLNVQGKLFGMDLAWTFNKGSGDTAYTEIQVSPDGRSNITTLGTFAYPTNKHEITGLQGNLTQFYRARIVDKLGNTSDWTDWVSGTTNAQADKVLDLLQGQIRQSQLHRDLSTPIAKILPLEQRLGQQTGKIATLETAVAGVNGQLGTLNQSLSSAQNNIATTQRELNTTKQQLATAQNTLSTAVANITTERNRITSAIRDITALQSANTAKTQEIANLTQTVNGHTSSIRDLAVTTGGLSQKYSQLKTVADKATSEITAIKQTQNGQATSIERLGVRFDNLVVGGRNLLLATNQSKALAGENRVNQSNVMFYAFSKQPFSQFGQTDFILSFDWEVQGADVAGMFRPEFNQHPWSAGFSQISVGQNNKKGRYVSKVSHRDLATTTANFLKFRLDNFIGTLVVSGAKLEIGNVATDWTPAPEDLQTAIDEKASTASLNEFKQTSANADTALGERISAIDTAYKKSDTDITARLAREETARTSGDNANAQALRTLESTVNGIGGRVGVSEGKIANLERTTSDLNGAIATAQSQLNARFNNLKIGGRNLLLASQVARATHGTTALTVSQNLDFGNVTHLVLSCDVRFANTQRATTQGAKWFRIGAEIRCVWTDGTSNWYGAWQFNVANGASFDGRVEHKIVIPTGKTLRTIDNARIQIWDITGENMLVKNPKLELGNIATDWTPAPEDLQTAIDEKASTASLNEFKQTSANADTALGERISAIDTAYKSADSQTTAKLGQLEQSISDKDRAMAQRVDTLNANYTALDNRTKWTELTAATDLNTLTETGKYFIRAGNNPNAPFAQWTYVVVEKARNDRITQTAWADNNTSLVYTRVYNGAWRDWEKTATGKELDTKATTASLNEFKQAQATKDQSTAQKLSQLESSLGTKATAAALNQTNTKLSQVEGRITAEASKYSTLQTTVGQHTASIQQHSQSINGLRAQWTVKVESGGIVSGIGLASENGNSVFAVRANKFYVADPTGTAKRPMFAILTSSTTINGVTVSAGTYISSAYIQNGSITTAKIANAAIDAAKIKDATITNAKIADAAITRAKIGHAQVDTLQIAGEAVTVPRAQSFDNHRSGLSGQVFSLSMNAMGGSVLVSASFLVDCTNTVSTRSSGHAKAIATINKKLKLVIKCNGSVISQRMFTFRDEREKEVSDNSNSGNRPVTATATAFVYDKMVSIINHVHRSPPANAVYTVELHDSGGEGSYVVTNGSVLLLGIKR